MKIERLRLRNFRGFAALELELDPQLTVLVGDNGSGKSTVLDALSLVARMLLLGQSQLSSVADISLGQHDGEVIVAFAAAAGSPWSTWSDAERAIGLDARLEIVGDLVIARQVPPLRALMRSPEERTAIVAYPVNRSAVDTTPGTTSPTAWTPDRAQKDAFENTASYQALFAWFREREDLENERFRRGDAEVDHQLAAVRDAVARVTDGAYRNLRVQRPTNEPGEHPAFSRPTLVVDKLGANDPLAFNLLSEGERTIIALVADIARRLAIANATARPLDGDGIVLIDEIDLHLHPRWQVEILGRLRSTFPSTQFIVATHSPLVLAGVDAAQLRVLEGFQLYRPAHPVAGRDAASLLEEIFDTQTLPAPTRAKVSEIDGLLQANDLAGARAALDALSAKLGDSDADVIRLRTTLDLLAS